MDDIMAKGPKVSYVNVRMNVEVTDLVDKAIRETQYVKDTDGLRSEYIRDAAAMRARAETGYLASHLAALIERYEHMVKVQRPSLSHEDWQTLVAATQNSLGYMRGLENMVGAILLQRVLDHLKLDASEATDSPLLRKMHAWTYAETVAALDFCERYWAAQTRGEEPPAIPGEPAAVAATKRKRGL